MGTRQQFQDLLSEIPEVKKAYFQPPEGYRMEYPCIVYSRDDTYKRHANNNPYIIVYRYLVTAIDKRPDSPIFRALELLPQSTFERAYAKGDLNHQVFEIYF